MGITVYPGLTPRATSLSCLRRSTPTGHISPTFEFLALGLTGRCVATLFAQGGEQDAEGWRVLAVEQELLGIRRLGPVGALEGHILEEVV